MPPVEKEDFTKDVVDSIELSRRLGVILPLQSQLSRLERRQLFKALLVESCEEVGERVELLTQVVNELESDSVRREVLSGVVNVSGGVGHT